MPVRSSQGDGTVLTTFPFHKNSEDGGRGCLLGGQELGPLILTLSGIGALGFHRKTVFEHIWSDSRGM